MTADGIDRIEIVNFRNPPKSGFPALADLALRFRLDRRFEAWLRELRDALDE